MSTVWDQETLGAPHWAWTSKTLHEVTEQRTTPHWSLFQLWCFAMCTLPKSKAFFIVTQYDTQHHTCIGRRHRTHTHTHSDEVAGEICPLPLTHPEVLVLPQGQPGAVYGARGPGQVIKTNLGQGRTGE